MARFKSKSILITGGSSGIGLATAKRLAFEGARVLVTGTNQERLDAAKQEIPGLIALTNDAGDPAAADALANAAREEFGTLDGVFLNAGFGRFQPLDQVSAEEFDAQFSVNVRGPLLHAKALAPLLESGGAVVLNTSVAHTMGMAGAAIYASTKGALRTLTRVLARELAERKIRVNAVSPGPVDSNFFARTGMPDEAIDGFAKQILSQVPLARFAEPDEIAAAVAFLLSSEASFITGAELPVDGGMSEV